MKAPTKERNHSNAQNVRRHKYGSLEEYMLGKVKKHEGTHTGEKPFKCSKCGQGGQGALQAREKHLKSTLNTTHTLKSVCLHQEGC